MQLYNSTVAIYPCTKDEPVFFDNDISKTLDMQFSKIVQKMKIL